MPKLRAETGYPYKMTKTEWIAWCCYMSGMNAHQTAYSLQIKETTVIALLRNGRYNGAPLRFGYPSADEDAKVNRKLRYKRWEGVSQWLR